MNRNIETDFTALTRRYQFLLQLQQTLLLSTVSETGVPDISYAPFSRDDSGCFNIYISALAQHTHNLLNNPQVSVMFIRPEADSPNLFARERAIFNCQAKEIARSDERYPLKLESLKSEFGEIINLLSTLNDFHLFSLSPQSGRYIMGFGQAFSIDPLKDTVIPLSTAS